MNPKRRTNLEIKRDMLNIIKRGVGVTRIVYEANLNFVIVHRHLEQLLEKGYIYTERKNRKNTYSLTDQGLQIIPEINRTIANMKMILF